MSSGLNKFLTCFCCSNTACCVASCIDVWAACEACGLAHLKCASCCWTICSPICYQSKCGDTGKGGQQCKEGIFYCLYSCCLQFVSPCDGCYNCVGFIKSVCGEGGKGFKHDMMTDIQWLNKKVKDWFKLENGSEPKSSFNKFTP